LLNMFSMHDESTACICIACGCQGLSQRYCVRAGHVAKNVVTLAFFQDLTHVESLSHSSCWCYSIWTSYGVTCSCSTTWWAERVGCSKPTHIRPCAAPASPAYAGYCHGFRYACRKASCQLEVNLMCLSVVQLPSPSLVPSPDLSVKWSLCCSVGFKLASCAATLTTVWATVS
jgi:hypothetical protein